jgi:hypothetical protein
VSSQVAGVLGDSQPTIARSWARFALAFATKKAMPQIECGPYASQRQGRCSAAQGIEAQRAETTGSVHESPVGNADAPTPGQSDNQQEDK